MFKKTQKQKDAIKLMCQNIEVLLEGGSRSGKTFISLYALIQRACRYNGSKHLIVRKHFAHVKSIWYDTLPKLLKICFPTLEVKENKTDWFCEFPNGSQLWFGGTDDKERIEKLLGWEWESIFINEGSQIPFDTYELLKTRLNPAQGIKPLLLIDYNPPSTQHWGYVIFHKGLNYENKQPLEDKDRYARLQMNPADNKNNLSDTYLSTLESMSERKRKRFLMGEYTDATEGALWEDDWIIRNRVLEMPNDLEVVAVGVDPAVTDSSKADDTGIIVAGKKKINDIDHYYVLHDATVHTSVTKWGQEVVKVYNKYMADRIIGETNQGGDLVEANIRNYDKNISYKSVRATRGKAVRAEPIADLYRRGLVHHVGIFDELELQMVSWVPGDKSPDNMDAMVWVLTYLSGLGPTSFGIGSA